MPATATKPTTPVTHSGKEEHDLVAIDTDEARSELQTIIERRQRFEMKPLLIIRPHHLRRAPDSTLVMLSDFGITIADDEIDRRRLAGKIVS